MRRILAALLLVASIPAACCNPKCDPENIAVYKEQASPEDTLEYVIHLARNDCGDLLYDVLDADSRDLIGELSFKLAYKSIDHPEWGGPIVNLVKGMRPDHPDAPRVVRIDGDEARIWCVTVFLDPERRFKEEILIAVLYREGGKWKVSAEETYRANVR